MGAGGDVEALRASSRTPDHTRTAQATAPSGVRLSVLTIAATGSIPLYIGPGVTNVSLERSRFTGRSASTAIYLDAESAGATIRGNTFDIRTGREQVAVDGSARNRIENNDFTQARRGGVFLYRNCGEDAVIRHQTPSDNIITDNRFGGAGLLSRAVVVGSREGRRRYCDADAGWPFGSSADDGDNARNNTVARNVVDRSLF
jgi:nitrous oxidase accessory protein NosD